jgi:hypothetical protein
MTVNWGALGITIGLVLVAVSILAVGFMVEKRPTVRLTTLEKEVPFIRAGIKRNIIAQEYAFSKADSEKKSHYS